ncbi:MAG: hypothetical protein ACXVAX_01885 [Pseudobdellovibrio sp.]
MFKGLFVSLFLVVCSIKAFALNPDYVRQCVEQAQAAFANSSADTSNDEKQIKSEFRSLSAQIESAQTREDISEINAQLTQLRDQTKINDMQRDIINNLIRLDERIF